MVVRVGSPGRSERPLLHPPREQQLVPSDHHLLTTLHCHHLFHSPLSLRLSQALSSTSALSRAIVVPVVFAEGSLLPLTSTIVFLLFVFSINSDFIMHSQLIHFVIIDEGRLVGFSLYQNVLVNQMGCWNTNGGGISPLISSFFLLYWDHDLFFKLRVPYIEYLF